MYQDGLTKQISGFCGTNKHMVYWKPQWSAVCPTCRSLDKRTSHVTTCREPGRKTMLHSSVEEVVAWAYELTNDYAVTTSMSKYLVSRWGFTFDEAGHEPTSAQKDSCNWTWLVKETNVPGWECLLEGNGLKQWILFTSLGLKRTGNLTSPE